jgi:hypothetical protein
LLWNKYQVIQSVQKESWGEKFQLFFFFSTTSVRKINLTFGLLHRLERWRKSHIGIVIAGKMASEKVWRKAESKKCESASNYQCPCIHWQVTHVDNEPIVKLLSRFKNQFWPWVCTDHCLHP